MVNVTKLLLFILIIAVFEYRLQAKRGDGRDGHQHKDSRDRDNSRWRSAIEYLPPTSGQRIRLAGYGNGTFGSGNIEVFIRNKWGIVCDDDWDKMDANVACRQLGFRNGAQQFTHNSQFGVASLTGEDILMDNVNCAGDEPSILTCNYNIENDCTISEGAGVICAPDTGCPDGWVAGNEGCYFLSNITTTQRKFAVNKCSQIGGHLVNIETDAENHFLSSVFSGIPGEPIIIGGIRKGRDWMWEMVKQSSSQSHNRGKRSPGNKVTRPKRAKKRGRSSSTSYISTTQVSIDFFKWFPGWMPGNMNSEPSGKGNEKCLYLSSIFQHPDKSQGDVDLGYLYWMDDVCARKRNRLRNGFRYLCERQREAVHPAGKISLTGPEECYRDNGVTYRGTQAFTEKGTPCIRWSESKKHTPERFPDKGLEGHNHCRNPDNDVRPWCYVNNQGKFGFCPVPQCSEVQVVATTPAPVMPTTSAQECPDEHFYCNRSVKCISEQWHCDYELDCDYGEDELSCDYRIKHFHVKTNRIIAEEHVKETFVGASNETCAKFCLSRESYVCRSFGFDPRGRKCQLSEVNSKTSLLPYIWSFRSNVYELISQTESCEGRFTCGNGRCIDLNLVCNQQDDCGDLSDEKLDRPKCRSSAEVKVRLADGDEQSGRVEVQYLGEWGVICDDNWDNNDAAVVCNMLGYKGTSAVATSRSKYGSGNGKFMLDEVKCIGIEDSIADCPHNGWKVHDCRSVEVAGVMCQVQKACTSDQYTCGRGQCIEASKVCDGRCDCLPGCEDENGSGGHDCKSASLEIVNGTQTGSGRVEIVRNGMRGTICDDSWDNMDAAVVCKMVGYRFGEAVSGGVFGQGTGPIWLDDIECTGTETSLSECKMSNWGVSDCSHVEDAGVICSNTPPETDTPPDSRGSLTVELFDGETPMEGRVEVIYNRERGTICDDGWDDEDATVVCKMLGFSYGTAKVEAFFGPGSDRIRILLDDVICTGSETTLAHCRHAGWGVSNCGHGEDAGVRCFMSEDGGEFDRDENVLSSVTCGLRPMESKSRKKREEPYIPESELEPPKFERIIGGYTAGKGFYPWQVGVQRLITDGIYSHWCGGTILSEHWILSAAHCFTELHKGHVLVRTGDHDNKVLDDFEQEFELENLISHPQYDEDSFDYDVALLKIKRKNGVGIKFGDHVQPACLPEQGTSYVEGQKCHVSGWGKTEYGYQNMLKSAKVPIISDATCRTLYKDITQRMMCAGYLAGGIDSCAGDSGGPLVCDISGRYTVMGATSWGAGCAEANAPGVYARITEFIPWIKSVIKQNS